MSIWTVRGVNANCADRNDVTGKGSPIGVPVRFVESSGPDVRDARAIRDEGQDPSVRPPPRLVVERCAVGDRAPRTTGRRDDVDRRRRGVQQIVREKGDPALIGRESLVEEIALRIRRDDVDGRIAGAVCVRDWNQAGRISFGRTESAGSEDGLAIFRPVGPLHLDPAGQRHDALTAAIRIEDRHGSVLSRVA